MCSIQKTVHNFGGDATAMLIWYVMFLYFHVHVPSASSTYGTDEFHAWNWRVPHEELDGTLLIRVSQCSLTLLVDYFSPYL